MSVEAAPDQVAAKDVAPAAVAFVAVDWNPVVDAAWWAKESAAIMDRLQRDFPHLGVGTLQAALAQATTSVAVGARIPNFLPVLVGRAAKENARLRSAELHPESAAESSQVQGL